MNDHDLTVIVYSTAPFVASVLNTVAAALSLLCTSVFASLLHLLLQPHMRFVIRTRSISTSFAPLVRLSVRVNGTLTGDLSRTSGVAVAASAPRRVR